ncbi:MAG: DMT family transporter [Planktomarina sp.]|uniref:DMT family transporter n=1 Tax=Planktomarina sp. TaxID=2024851 RepID=UPI00288DF035|nr:DMT family transporter [Planktomarina sp.]MDG1295106.1 DMT family transporter [Planktomarina sp.]MDT2032031.1 DMT family transporter [Planktomarina sp.]MDT2070309.1 DMT family transporter [Planktomarina sp.]
MDIRAILAGLAFALIWSSAFTSARIIVADAPPILSLSLRFLISGLIGIALARFLGQSWRLTPGQWRATIVFGLCQNALYLGLNFVAMQTVEASLASIIASTMPLAVGFAGWVVFRERLSALGVLGLCAGAGGVALIMGARMQAGADFYGIALCFIAVASLSVATLMVRGASSGGNLLMIVGLQMLVGSAFLVIPGLIFDQPVVNWSVELVLAFSYTVLMPGLVATFIWFWLVQRIGAVKAATFHFLNPFFGVMIAAVLLGETLRIWDIVGVAVIMFGILAVQMARQTSQ